MILELLPHKFSDRTFYILSNEGQCVFRIEAVVFTHLTLSRRRLLSYRIQSIDLRCKSMDRFLYDNGLRHERVNQGHMT